MVLKQYLMGGGGGCSMQVGMYRYPVKFRYPVVSGML